MVAAEVREHLADYAHQAWCDYMAWFLANCQERPDGSLVIPAGYVAAITRLMQTPYRLLSEGQKTKDRAEAEKIMIIIEPLRGD
jgi:hypothetical protein